MLYIIPSMRLYFLILCVSIYRFVKADFPINFCQNSYNCSDNGNRCGGLINTQINDRNGYVCGYDGKCNAPQCSFIPGYSPQIAPACPTGKTCNGSNMCIDHNSTSIIDFGFFSSLGGVGSSCSSICNYGLYCSVDTKTCQPVKRIVGSCDISCNQSNECYSSVCYGGQCLGTHLNVGMPCNVSQQCLSGNCSNGVCYGIDCSTLSCPDDSFCVYNGLLSACYPILSKFSCDFTTHYPELSSDHTVWNCVPKKLSGTCSILSNECVSGICYYEINSKDFICYNYSVTAAPLNAPCFAGIACDNKLSCTGGYCKEAPPVVPIPDIGQTCTTVCKSPYVCVSFVCGISPTHKKPCGWNVYGFDNCTNPEICMCLGSTTPLCYLTTDMEYQQYFTDTAKIPYVDSSTAYSNYLTQTIYTTFSVLENEIKNILDTNGLACYTKFGIDPTLFFGVPSNFAPAIIGPEFSCLIGSNKIEDLSDECRKSYASFVCCFFCSGDYISEIRKIPNLEQYIFGSQYNNNIYHLQCGNSPDFVIDNPNTCTVYKDLPLSSFTSINCPASQNVPTYYTVTITITFTVTTNLNEGTVTSYVQLYIKNYDLPVTSKVTFVQNTPNQITVNIYYFGDNAKSNANQVQSSMNNNLNEFLAKIGVPVASSQTVVDTSVSSYLMVSLFSLFIAVSLFYMM